VRDASAQKPARDTTLRHPTTLSSYYPATPANWTEHVVPKNPGTDPDKSLLCNMKLQSFGREVSPCSVSSLFALNALV
jgi:hypothetical protein